MFIKDGFVLNIPSYLKPSYQISPFRTQDMLRNRMTISNFFFNNSNYLDKRFDNKYLLFTEDGRSALEKSILALGLKKDDTITIFTTTNNLYISGCVTQKIEKYCNWSREIESSTKAILINHEFGYCVEDMEYYKSLGYPMIEDFAHSFSASNTTVDVGKYSDFLIFSLSKIFPMQMGGVLMYSKQYYIKDDLIEDKRQYISSLFSNYIQTISSINKKRLENYYLYKKLFKKIGIQPTLELHKNNIPAVFIFDLEEEIDLDLMKDYINNHGIESSVFYGKHSYFIPNHQNLDNNDIEYIFTVVKSFLENYSYGKNNEGSKLIYNRKVTLNNKKNMK